MPEKDDDQKKQAEKKAEVDFGVGKISFKNLFQGIESLEVHNNVFFRVGGAAIDKIVLETRVKWVSGRVSEGSNN